MERVITEEERRKCEKLLDLFGELFIKGDIVVIDGGTLGFALLHYNLKNRGNDRAGIYRDSAGLFEGLWREWREKQIYRWVTNTPLEALGCEEILAELPEYKGEMLDAARAYFQAKAEEAYAQEDNGM